MSGIVNIMVAPSPLLTSGSPAADRRAVNRIWDIRARISPQGRGIADRFHYEASRVLFGDGA